jgi:inhibitor of KinA sporulation pathway (predicted exonuclease)
LEAKRKKRDLQDEFEDWQKVHRLFGLNGIKEKYHETFTYVKKSAKCGD